MRTRKQVLADFYKMQKRLFADDKRHEGTAEVRTYNNGEYWCISILVCHADLLTGKHDEWEEVEWRHYSRHSEVYERANETALAEFKAKFNL